MRLFNQAWRTTFGRRSAALLGLVTILVLATNPELLSLMLLINVVGVDIFILLLGVQIRQNWSVLRTFIVSPICLRIKLLLGRF